MVAEHEFERATQFGFGVVVLVLVVVLVVVIVAPVLTVVADVVVAVSVGFLVGEVEGNLVGLELLGLSEGEKVGEDIAPIGAPELVELEVGVMPWVGDADGDSVPPTEHPAVRLTS